MDDAEVGVGRVSFELVPRNVPFPFAGVKNGVAGVDGAVDDPLFEIVDLVGGGTGSTANGVGDEGFGSPNTMDWEMVVEEEAGSRSVSPSGIGGTLLGATAGDDTVEGRPEDGPAIDCWDCGRENAESSDGREKCWLLPERDGITG